MGARTSKHSYSVQLFHDCEAAAALFGVGSSLVNRTYRTCYASVKADFRRKTDEEFTMLSFYVVLLTAWLGLLATARGLLAADCDSATEHLVLLDEAQYSSDDMLSDERVVLEGVVQSVFSPQNFIIQVSPLSANLHTKKGRWATEQQSTHYPGK